MVRTLGKAAALCGGARTAYGRVTLSHVQCASRAARKGIVFTYMYWFGACAVRGALIRAESKRHKHLLLKQPIGRWAPRASLVASPFSPFSTCKQVEPGGTRQPIGGNRCQTSKTRMCARLEIRTGRLAPVERAQCERNAGLLA